jgi:inosine-uridine nucleoside N-ribohydrolase
MLPLEVTHTALATPAVLQRILERGTPFLCLMHKLLMFFAHTYKEVFNFEHPPLHDPLAVFFVTCPSAFKVTQNLSIAKVTLCHCLNDKVFTAKWEAWLDCMQSRRLIPSDSCKIWVLSQNAMRRWKWRAIQARGRTSTRAYVCSLHNANGLL